jgi:hypothetical protein
MPDKCSLKLIWKFFNHPSKNTNNTATCSALPEAFVSSSCLAERCGLYLSSLGDLAVTLKDIFRDESLHGNRESRCTPKHHLVFNALPLLKPRLYVCYLPCLFLIIISFQRSLTQS